MLLSGETGFYRENPNRICYLDDHWNHLFTNCHLLLLLLLRLPLPPQLGRPSSWDGCRICFCCPAASGTPIRPLEPLGPPGYWRLGPSGVAAHGSSVSVPPGGNGGSDSHLHQRIQRVTSWDAAELPPAGGPGGEQGGGEDIGGSCSLPHDLIFRKNSSGSNGCMKLSGGGCVL